MKRKRVVRAERRRRMPEIDLNESPDRKPMLDKQGFAQVFGQLRHRMRPGQNGK